MGYHNGLTFEKQLRKQIGEFIIVLVKSGADCCELKGVLCNVEQDFLVLINNNQRIEIPLGAIVAIKKKVKGSKQNRREDNSCFVENYE